MEIEDALEKLAAPYAIVALLRKCLQKEAMSRPSFQEIVSSLEKNESIIAHFTLSAKTGAFNYNTIFYGFKVSTDSYSFSNAFWSAKGPEDNAKKGTSKSPPHKDRRRRLIMIIIPAILVLVAIIAGVLVYGLKKENHMPPSSSLLNSNYSSTTTLSISSATTPTVLIASSLSLTSSGLTSNSPTATASPSSIPTTLPPPNFPRFGANVITGTFLDLCNSSSTTVVRCSEVIPEQIINSSVIVMVANCVFKNCPRIMASSPLAFMNVTFFNSTFRTLHGSNSGGNDYIGGGAISTNSVANFTNCRFIACTATYVAGGSSYYGGSIFADYGSKIFIKDTLIQSSSSDLDGGAIYVSENATLEMVGTSINGSTANFGFGGGIYSDQKTVVTITNSSISFCSSPRGGGGAIMTNGFLDVTNSTILSNSVWSTDGGGGLSIKGGSARLRHVVFSKNMAKSGSGGGLEMISGQGSTLSMQDVLFISNSAAENGGGAYVSLDYVENIPFVSNVSFEKNNAEIDGGGLYLSISGQLHQMILIFQDTSFIENRSLQDGGGLLLNHQFNRAYASIAQRINVIGDLLLFSNNHCATAYQGNDIAFTQFGTDSLIIIEGIELSNCTLRNHKFISIFTDTSSLRTTNITCI